MPSLKGLTCSIEPAHTKEPLQEYGTIYNDGFVETFVAVPSDPKPFTVHLKSTQYIASGLAMYVFIDGVYQCNRNRQGLKSCNPPDTRRSLVDFRVRQKEEKRHDGTTIARDWMFEKLQIAAADGAPKLCSPDILDNIGCIEVVVLRCEGFRTPAIPKPPSFGYDGANDFRGHHFGLDGQVRDWYADDDAQRATERFVRSQQQQQRERRSSGQSRGSQSQMPSGPKSVRSHATHSYMNARDDSPSIVERLHARTRPRHSRPVSPGYTGRKSLPPGGFSYGHGPVPHASKTKAEAEPFRHHTTGIVATDTDKPIMDPILLQELIDKTVRLQLERERQKGTPPQFHERSSRPEIPRQLPPGAWPSSPGGAPEEQQQQHPQPPRQSRKESTVTWGDTPTPTRLNIVNWNISNTQGDNVSDAWETSSWGTNDNHNIGRPRRVSNPSRIVAPPPAPNSPPLDLSWENIKTISGDSSDRWSTPSNAVMVPRPEVIGEVETPWSVKGVPVAQGGVPHPAINLQTPAWNLPTAGSSSGPTHNVGWSGMPVEGIVPSTSGTWGTVAPTNAIPPQNVAAEWQQPVEAIPPAPAWGCGVPHMALKPNGHVPNPPPPYGMPCADFMRIGSGDIPSDIQSNASSPWGVPKKVDNPPNWGVASKEQASSEPGSWGNDNATVKNNASNGWSHSEQKENRSAWGGDDANNNGAATDWKNDSWGGSKSDNKANDDEKEKEKEHDSKSQGQGSNAWGSDEWNKPDNDASKDQKNDASGDVVDSSWDTNNDASRQNDTSGGGGAWDKDANAWAQGAEQKNGTSGGANTWNINNNNNTGGVKPKSNDQPQDNTQGGDTAHPAASVAVSAKHSIDTCRSSRYKRLRNTSSTGVNKAWKFPPEPPKNKFWPIPEECSSETPDGGGMTTAWKVREEALLEVPKDKAEEKMVEHQVRAGKGTEYTHIVGRPKYIDDFDTPASLAAPWRYGVFRFKYRSRAILQSILGHDDVPDSPSTSPSLEAQFKALEKVFPGLTPEEIMKKMVEMTKQGGSSAKAPTLVSKWVDDQQTRSKEASLNGKKSEGKAPSVQAGEQTRGGGDAGWGGWGGAASDTKGGDKGWDSNGQGGRAWADETGVSQNVQW
ncbi:hypothetical protein K504DRAFT_494267 [Pleomassaria siparia CBS 279.74]|uniref:Uncharacterized protein n=1 Tax=Pleomassaria siparia CBS 279.74 TaxID=1314801 RepID=A0A6G1JXP3_9PLEO|nr:hypothetical protein K504DRAFT_494267 [Pleomassaria siparia CBS 279.74]